MACPRITSGPRKPMSASHSIGVRPLRRTISWNSLTDWLTWIWIGTLEVVRGGSGLAQQRLGAGVDLDGAQEPLDQAVACAVVLLDELDRPLQARPARLLVPLVDHLAAVRVYQRPER